MNHNDTRTPEELARLRAQLIIQVQSGLLSATEAAQLLGVSRKTYYEWEKRALEGMMDGLTNRPVGRPKKEVDLEQERLQNRLSTLEQQNHTLQAVLGLKDRIQELEQAEDEETSSSPSKATRQTASMRRRKKAKVKKKRRK